MWPSSYRMASEVLQQQFVYTRRHLIRRIVPHAGESGEATIRLDELGGAFGGHPADRTSASPQINRVGTLVGPIGCRSPRARYQANAASIADWLPITDKCLWIASCGTPLRAS